MNIEVFSFFKMKPQPADSDGNPQGCFSPILMLRSNTGLPFEPSEQYVLMLLQGYVAKSEALPIPLELRIVGPDKKPYGYSHVSPPIPVEGTEIAMVIQPFPLRRWTIDLPGVYTAQLISNGATLAEAILIVVEQGRRLG